MGVYIKGMDIPYDCEHCDFNIGYYCKRQWDDETYLIRFESNLDKRNNCPLVAVKAPHGRLGDLDALAMKWIFGQPEKREIQESPTIIEAEGKDDG